MYLGLIILFILLHYSGGSYVIACDLWDPVWLLCNTTEPKNMLGINLVIDTAIYPICDLQHWWSLSNLIKIAALRNTQYQLMKKRCPCI